LVRKGTTKYTAKTTPIKAVQYLNNLWLRLIAYVDYSGWPIANNRAEKLNSPFVIGRNILLG